MANDKQDTDAAPKKGGKKMIIIVLAAVLVLGGGGAGAYFMLGKKDSKPVEGAVVALDAVTINLQEGHFLKVRIALQATEDAGEEVDGSKALDILISQFSNQSVAELSSNEAREAAKKQLQTKIYKAYDKKVMEVYFTEFVMQ